MTRFFVRAAVVLMVLFTVVLVLIRAQPYDDSELQKIRDSLSGCPTPCFLGIQPGITTSKEAFAILRHSDWIRNLRMEKSGLIWEWSGIQPSWINHKFSGELHIQNRKVWAIYLQTEIPLMAALFEFGLPEGIMISVDWDYVQYEGVYTTKDITFTVNYTCPIKTDPLKMPVSSLSFVTSISTFGFYGWISRQELYIKCV